MQNRGLGHRTGTQGVGFDICALIPVAAQETDSKRAVLRSPMDELAFVILQIDVPYNDNLQTGSTWKKTIVKSFTCAIAPLQTG